MDALKYFFEFFFRKDTTIRNKFFLIIFIVSAILFVDHMLGFSSSYFANNKIEQVGKLQKILESDKLSPQQRSAYLKLHNDAINYNRVTSPKNHDNRFYSFWYTISYGGILILFTVFMIANQLLAISPSIAIYPLSVRVAQAVWATFIMIVVFIIAAVFAWIYAYVPSTGIPYILSLITQTVLLYATFYAFAREATQQAISKLSGQQIQ